MNVPFKFNVYFNSIYTLDETTIYVVNILCNCNNRKLL